MSSVPDPTSVGSPAAPPGRGTPPRNNFDLLRFVFAFMVVLSHSYMLSGEAPLAILAKVVSTLLAVKGFFIVSGYLIFMSHDNSRSLSDYAGKRIRRIYPAYAAVVLGCVVLGAFLTTLPLGIYFSSGVGRYLAANLTFLNTLGPTLPGVFAGHPTTQVNSALWTLKVEAMFYVSVPVIAWICRRLGRGRTFLALYALSATYVIVLGIYARRTGDPRLLQLQNQLPGQLAYFVSGAAGYYYGPMLARRWAALAAGSVAAFGLMWAVPSEPVSAILEPAAIAGLVLWAALGIRHLGNFGRFGDFSYGVYIIHCPVIQTLVHLGLFRQNPWAAFGVAVVLVLGLAVLCWHFVEKPFLKKTSHYVQADASARSGERACPSDAN